MKISQLGEFALIEKIKKLSASPYIGDDCAIVDGWLISCDQFVEGVHFDFKHFTFKDLGWRFLAASLSDIAAMGGIPKYALVSLALPKNTEVKDIQAFWRGFQSLAKKHKVVLVGGDTSASLNGIFCSITVMGKPSKKGPVLRSGAKKGDFILALGSNWGKTWKENKRPQPRIKEGIKLAESGLISSMIDSSDGLARSVWEICRASSCGARVFDLPHKILYSGEEYELVFTAQEKNIPFIKKLISLPLIAAGCILPMKDGINIKEGFQHFKP